MTDRHLAWSGCFNARNLGGLRTTSGRVLRRGAVIRSDGLDELDETGWHAVRAHGVRTIIDLRNDDERLRAPRPAGVDVVHMPIDESEDRAFWDAYDADWSCGTPLYYLPYLARFPRRSARVVQAIAHAAPGGVVVHCSAGRDRTGMVTMLLLALLDVDRSAIVDDYMESVARLPPLFAHRGEPDQGPLIDAFLEELHTQLRTVLADTLAAIDLAEWRRAGGFGDADHAALLARLLG